MSLKDIDIRGSYTGKGEDILEDFLLPVLKRSVCYDRITGYYTIESLLAISQGIESIFEKQGTMRLIIGLHSVPADLIDAVSMHEYLHDEIEMIRNNLQNKILSLKDSLEKKRIATLAWMIEDNLLEVKAAAVIGKGIFHPKTLIFYDSEHNEIAAVGSSNETSNGLGGNFEQLMVAKSWENKDAVDDQKRFFESLWKNQMQDVYVEDISEDTKDMIIKSIGNEIRRPVEFRFEENIISKMSKMPANFFVSGDIPSLFMHQERAVIDALSRWPVRVMLSDEVGLGKTFEAAAILAFLIKYSAIDRVMILTPRSVMQQWQDELLTHFKLDAWLYDSTRKEYRSAYGRTIKVGNRNPLGEVSPDLILMSAQFARGTKGNSDVFSRADTILPKLLIVDEAHSARVSTDLSGKRKKTRMYKMLESISKKIPHIILATATPMQKDALEYHAMLKILGLPKIWEKEENYDLSLKIISSNRRPDHSDAVNAGGLLFMTLKKMKPALDSLTEDEKVFVHEFYKEFNVLDNFDKAEYILKNWERFKKIFIELHPARLLTVRNTRKSLVDIGYQFPVRKLREVNLYNSEEIELFYDNVNAYLSNECFSIEKALYPERRINLSFIRTSYQQRVASSLYSCRESLNKRAIRADILFDQVNSNNPGLIYKNFDLSSTIDDIEQDELLFSDENILDSREKDSMDKREILRALSIEKAALGSLIIQADRLLDTVGDMKINRSLDLALESVKENDAVLLFSRYTDTIDALIHEFKRRESKCAYAVYTGNKALIVENGKEKQSDKDEIKRALFSKKIRIVFCSDAASEGLNLQAARVLINVDVPWTPARLEQRIGRIARLGQIANEVDIYNVWYPNSIEAKMYNRIQRRLRDSNIAVGEFPEVVAEGIKRAILNNEPEDQSLEQLKSIRNSYQTKALESLWVSKDTQITTSAKIRKDLIRLCQQQFEYTECFSDEDIRLYQLPDGKEVELSEKCGLKESINLKSEPFRYFDLKSKKLICINDENSEISYFSSQTGHPIRFENILDIAIEQREIVEDDHIKGWPKTLLNPLSLNLNYSIECDLKDPPVFWELEGERENEC